jgi:hypothetical protein
MHSFKLAGLLLYSAFAPGDLSTTIDPKRNSALYQALSAKDKFLVAISWNYYRQNSSANKPNPHASGFKKFILRFFLGKEAAHKLNAISSSLRSGSQDEISMMPERFTSYITPYYQNFTLSPILLVEWEQESAGAGKTIDIDGILHHWSNRINPFAFFNPLNYWRALDTIPSTIALWCYAKSDLSKERGSPGKSWGFYLLGHIFSLITAAIRWPRVGLQFMIGLSVRPLWHCIRRVVKQDNPGKITWALAIILTTINLVLLGLPNAIFTFINFFAILFTDAPLKSATFLQDLGFGYMNDIGSEVKPAIAPVVENVLKPISNAVNDITGGVFGPPISYAATGTDKAAEGAIETALGDMMAAEGMKIGTRAGYIPIVHGYNNHLLAKDKAEAASKYRDHLPAAPISLLRY